MLNLSRNLFVYCFAISLLLFSCREKKENAREENPAEEVMQESSKVSFIKDDANKKVDVKIDGGMFTSYIYDGQTPKPILYPLITKSGKTVTRGFPYAPRPNERVDHPHHAGHWLNYGDVNGFDFWNNSYAVSDKDKHKYGTIFHQEILESDSDNGVLKIKAAWRSPLDADLLEEVTEFRFSEEGETRIIDRSTTLRALVDVSFKDNKEGMIGIRVARELELPSEKPAIYTDAEGNVTEVKALNNEGVNGNYFGSEGLTGNDVWGTRNKWVKLESNIEGETVSITIIDHEKNVGYPTYWHARDYGLFAANPLGQAIFSEGKETLYFELKKGESTTFNYRILIHNGSELSKEALDESFADFNKD
ncbi:MAG: PmoA family protein [Aurantibacter sp.]